MYKHMKQLQETERETHNWLEKNEALLSENSCICLPCVKRNINNPLFHPKWRKKVTTPPPRCRVNECEQFIYTNTNLVSVDQLERLLGTSVDKQISTTSSIGLCQTHYLHMYSQLNEGSTQCDSCREKIKRRDVRRRCPAPNVMNYLDQISGEPQNLTSSSILCNSCYQHITRIVKEIREVENSAPGVERKHVEEIITKYGT